jgi:tRNA (guanine6-N2)-methyltransferase
MHMPRPTHAPSGPIIELVVPEGLEAIARDELRSLGRDARLLPDSPPGVLRISYTGDLRRLLQLRSVTSAAIVQRFAVPRPKALLGDAQFRAMLALITKVMRLHPAGAFQSLYLSAAGADSTVLSRLKQDLALALALEVGREDGDLLLRLRRSADSWELLVRLGPRPLATRTWRVCNLEGALNGPVAHAMALLSAPAAHDVVLNIACGSGTLLIERLLLGPVRRAIGCDTSPAALACAQANVAAAGLNERCELTDWDARSLPLPAASVSVILADLPFGHLVGSHAENLALYPALLAEAARVARPGARCVLISHELRLLDNLLAERNDWQIVQRLRVDVGGLKPQIVVLQR